MIWLCLFIRSIESVDTRFLSWNAVAAMGTWGAVAVAVIALAIAWVGIGVTATSAYFVWRLGVEANEASKSAVRIAEMESKRQAAKDKKERRLVLLQMNGEVWENRSKAQELQKKLTAIDAISNFVRDGGFRSVIIAGLAKINFPVADLLVDRLHYLHEKEGPALARSVGMIRSVNREYQEGISPLTQENLVSHHAAICIVIEALIIDLTVIADACEKEIRASGIEDAMIDKRFPVTGSGQRG